MDTLQVAWLAVMVAGMLPFADGLRLTRGQPFTVERTRARLLLLAAEVTLGVAWAALKWGAGADRHCVPPAVSGAARLAGLALTVAGVGLAGWAKIRLGRWFSGTFGIKPGHELVTDGPYAVTRHPIYSGLLGALAGSALVWDSLLTMALAVVLLVPFWRHTVIEESLFAQHFGDAYRRYQRRVPRLVPFATRPREDA